MERIHYIIGIIIFVIFTAAASGQQGLETDERIVALTLLGEARGEGVNGMYAVSCVIQKRMQEKYKTAEEVCRQPWQFSIWNAGKGKVKKESDLQHLWKSECNAVRVASMFAKQICNNWKFVQNFTGHANHYYSTDIKPPYWTYKKVIKNGKEVKVPIKPTRKIGKHVFYKL